MASIIDELMITLGLDGSGAKKGMNDVVSTVSGGMQKVKASVETGLASVSKIFTGFGAAIMGAFSIGSAFSTWKEQATELGALSRKLKMSMEDLQGWTGAMAKFGGSSSDFESTIRGLNGQLARMATLGKSRTGTLLQSMGIDAGEVGRQRNALDVLVDIAGVMEQMTDEEARGIGEALGLDPAMIELTKQGRDAMKELIRQKKQDAVYTKEDADAIKAYNVAMGGLKKEFMRIASVLFRMITPALTVVTNHVKTFVSYLRKHQTAVKAFFVMIAALVTTLLIPAFLNFFRVLMRNPFTWVILAIAGLAMVIDDFIGWMNGKKSALEDLWVKLFGSPEEAKQTFEDLRKTAEGFMNDIIPSVKELIQDFKDLVKGLKDLATELGDSEGWATFKEAASDALDFIKDKLDSLGKAMLDFRKGTDSEHEMAFGALQTSMETGSSPIGEYLKAQWNSFTDTLSSVWDSAVETLSSGWDEFADFGSDILERILEAAKRIFEEIQKIFDDVMKECEKAAERFANAASSAIGGLNSAISSLAGSIRANLIGAIDDAAARWQAFQAEVSAGNAAIMASAGDYGGAGSYNSTSNTEWNVTLNGVQNGQQAASDFRSGVGSKFSSRQSNAGVW
jgi:phage-related protein